MSDYPKCPTCGTITKVNELNIASQICRLEDSLKAKEAELAKWKALAKRQTQALRQIAKIQGAIDDVEQALAKAEGKKCDSRCLMHDHMGHECDCGCVCHKKPAPGEGATAKPEDLAKWVSDEKPPRHPQPAKERKYENV